MTLLKSIAFGKVIWLLLEFLRLYLQLHCLTAGAGILRFSAINAAFLNRGHILCFFRRKGFDPEISFVAYGN